MLYCNVCSRMMTTGSVDKKDTPLGQFRFLDPVVELHVAIVILESSGHQFALSIVPSARATAFP